MTQRLLKPLLLTTLFAVSACGAGGGTSVDGSGGSGGGGGGAGGDDGGGPGGPVLPTIDDSTSISQTTRIANFQIGDAGTPGIGENASIQLDAGYLTAISGTVELFGQSVSITNGRGTLNGQEVRVEIDASSVGAFAVPVSVFSYGPNLASPANPSGEAAFVVGQETAGSYLSAQPNGSVNYSGGFAVQGVLQIGGCQELAELEGDITVNVSFGGADTATATLDGAYDPASGGPRSVELGITNAPISENGFGGTLSCISGCSTNGSTIDATFYGPEAEEVGGVLAIDITRGGEVYEGAGTFVINQ